MKCAGEVVGIRNLLQASDPIPKNPFFVCLGDWPQHDLDVGAHPELKESTDEN